jgi:hypothetical protein
MFANKLSAADEQVRPCGSVDRAVADSRSAAVGSGQHFDSEESTTEHVHKEFATIPCFLGHEQANVSAD